MTMTATRIDREHLARRLDAGTRGQGGHVGDADIAAAVRLALEHRDRVGFAHIVLTGPPERFGHRSVAIGGAALLRADDLRLMALVRSKTSLVAMISGERGRANGTV